MTLRDDSDSPVDRLHDFVQRLVGRELTLNESGILDCYVKLIVYEALRREEAVR